MEGLNYPEIVMQIIKEHYQYHTQDTQYETQLAIKIKDLQPVINLKACYSLLSVCKYCLVINILSPVVESSLSHH